MYLLIIILPLLSSLASGFFGRRIGVNGAHFVNTISIILTTVLCILVFFEVGFNSTSVYIKLIRWIDSESFNIFWSFNFDSLTVSMLIPVLIVSCLVHMYSIGYMSHDPHNQRFFSYLSLFTFMMIILVTSDNYLLMFVGWEGVGICSYLLVSFWFTRIAANQSSISALLTNRVGDCFLTIGMFALIWSVGNIDYATVFSLAPFINENIVTIVGICLLIGAMAKSSQIGLHVWLPMAMEGPTPVSALIHAATMVTAGVYLLMRSSPLIEYSSTILLLSLWIGAFTTVFSSLIGLFQQDIKKVIAYSTMSQLGMMVIAVGLSSYNIALYHLVNHAFYKALLFLGAGSVIHAVSDNQDFRKYGGLKPFLPLTYSVMLIASLSLVAFPFMTGFYSKDFILESALGQFCFSSIAVYVIATIGAIFTALYSSKVLYLTFIANPAGAKINYKNAHESDMFITIPLILLAVLSIYFGYLTRDLFIGLGFDLYADNALFVHPNHEIAVDTEFAVPTLFKLLPLGLTILFIIIALILSEFYSSLLLLFKFNRLGYNIFSLFSQRFYIELFYNKYITDFVLKIGNYTTKVLDKGSVELMGPLGLQKILLFVSNIISNLKIKSVTTFALYILIFAVSYAAIFYIVNSNLLIIVTFSISSLLCFSYYSSSNSIVHSYQSNKVLENRFLPENIIRKIEYWHLCLLMAILVPNPKGLASKAAIWWLYLYAAYIWLLIALFSLDLFIGYYPNILHALYYLQPFYNEAMQGFSLLHNSAMQGFSILHNAAMQGFSPLHSHAMQGFSILHNAAMQGFSHLHVLHNEVMQAFYRILALHNENAQGSHRMHAHHGLPTLFKKFVQAFLDTIYWASQHATLGVDEEVQGNSKGPSDLFLMRGNNEGQPDNIGSQPDNTGSQPGNSGSQPNNTVSQPKKTEYRFVNTFSEPGNTISQPKNTEYQFVNTFSESGNPVNQLKNAENQSNNTVTQPHVTRNIPFTNIRAAPYVPGSIIDRIETRYPSSRLIHWEGNIACSGDPNYSVGSEERPVVYFLPKNFKADMLGEAYRCSKLTPETAPLFFKKANEVSLPSSEIEARLFWEHGMQRQANPNAYTDYQALTEGRTNMKGGQYPVFRTNRS